MVDDKHVGYDHDGNAESVHGEENNEVELTHVPFLKPNLFEKYPNPTKPCEYFGMIARK